MSFANHYQTLQVLPTASADEIKKAYRRLALQYHPDLAGDDVNAATQFRHIKAAYDVIGNAKTRQAYHYKYFFTNYTFLPVITAETIEEEAMALVKFASIIDPYRIDVELLNLQLTQLLSPPNLILLKRTYIIERNRKIVKAVLRVVLLLPINNALPTYSILTALSGEEQVLISQIKKQTIIQKRLHLWHSYKLLLAFVMAFILCIVMYFLVPR